jgi:hypothetical protein
MKCPACRESLLVPHKRRCPAAPKEPRRTHYLPGRYLSDSTWAREALKSFASPAACGCRGWRAASDKPRQVDCKRCLQVLRRRQEAR